MLCKMKGSAQMAMHAHTNTMLEENQYIVVIVVVETRRLQQPPREIGIVRLY